MCLQPRFLSLPLDGFRSHAYASGTLLSRSDQKPNKGDMNFTLRIKKNILRAAMIAVLVFAGGNPARATDQPSVANVKRPSEIRTIGMIEIPAVGLATRVLEGSNAPTLRLAVGH